jgi:hypothetical protein
MMDVRMVPIDVVQPYERNPRRPVTDTWDAAVARVAASLTTYGWRQPIVVDGEMVVIAGHTRLRAAQSLGMTEVPVHVAADLDPALVRAYRIADNRAHESTRWDDTLLPLELGDLKALGVDLGLVGFDAVLPTDGDWAAAFEGAMPDADKDTYHMSFTLKKADVALVRARLARIDADKAVALVRLCQDS